MGQDGIGEVGVHSLRMAVWIWDVAGNSPSTWGPATRRSPARPQSPPGSTRATARAKTKRAGTCEALDEDMHAEAQADHKENDERRDGEQQTIQGSKKAWDLRTIANCP